MVNGATTACIFNYQALILLHSCSQIWREKKIIQGLSLQRDRVKGRDRQESGSAPKKNVQVPRDSSF